MEERLFDTHLFIPLRPGSNTPYGRTVADDLHLSVMASIEKRTRTGKRKDGNRPIRKDGSSMLFSVPKVVRGQVRREPIDRSGHEPGLTIVAGPQFDALLALLDDPPKVTDEAGREVATRRWK